MPRLLPVPLVLATCLAVAFSSLSAASAAGPGRAPWVTASTTTSITLDWPGGSSGYRTFYATSYSGVLTSSTAKKSAGSAVRITGLKPGQMYCFQTATGSGANRSQRYCHSTMRHANRSSQTRVGIATFNVCGVANGCRSWRPREDAVIARIREARADVVAIQEGSSVLGRIARRLTAHGYALASASSTEGVFYRTSKLAQVTTSSTETVCEDETVPDEVDTSTWDTESGTHTDTDGVTWTYDGVEWAREVCEPVTTTTPVAGTFRLGGAATATWARLRVKKTKKSYVFVSAHLTAGKSAGNARSRDGETRRLITKAKDEANGVPIVFAGDFNSHRNRPNDSPRLRFERAGYRDAYDRSARYSKAYINSYNGYEKRPVRGVKYGDHVDHVFLHSRTGADSWAVVAPTRGGRNVTPIASDHNLVRVTALLP
ncbi:endonuclease/exonuclease/phosphatase family protein [Aeromicrobium stalagmiti]|uniref:endonuclease/exonuclease/phosphatase family protein n=1 Tax=Aeromicrobium stalagmiti TaxID=2738988 RepID=UPI00156982E5|nr:endonuclease/exonuclease/phosphatase family protein [Aeromicrobium stalagmiti]NRQ51665.1 endonuclease/exonuclease/phosphatase family protein [Aeromicrobium stalagmiti]